LQQGARGLPPEHGAQASTNTGEEEEEEEEPEVASGKAWPSAGTVPAPAPESARPAVGSTLPEARARGAYRQTASRHSKQASVINNAGHRPSAE